MLKSSKLLMMWIKDADGDIAGDDAELH